MDHTFSIGDRSEQAGKNKIFNPMSKELFRVTCGRAFSCWNMAEDCLVHKIHHGNFLSKAEKRKWRLLRTSYTTITTFQNVTEGERKPQFSSLLVKCNSNYTFQGKRDNEAIVSCLKGKWVPYPVCLKTGTFFRFDATEEEKTNTTNRNARKFYPRRILEKQCTCTYSNPDTRLVAYSGNELLQNGKKVKKNSKMKFHCSHIGYYRLMGTSELECKYCRTWNLSEYPQCVEPVTGDAVLVFHNQNAVVLPGGSLGIEEGEDIRILCVSNGISKYPQWVTPTYRNVKLSHNLEYDFRTNFTWYATILHIVNANQEHNGKYQCSVRGYRPNTIEIQVIGVLGCSSLVSPDASMIVEPEKNMYSFGEVVTLSCPSGKFLSSDVVRIMCLNNGWSESEIPHCKEK